MALNFSKLIHKLEQSLALSLQVTGGEIPSLRVASSLLVRKLKLKLSRPGSGRSYPRGKRRRHVASAPGEPPAVDTGRLRNSITAEAINAYTVRVGTDVEYAPELEFGTLESGGYIAPRPWFRSTIEETKKELTDAVIVSIRDELKRGTR